MEKHWCGYRNRLENIPECIICWACGRPKKLGLLEDRKFLVCERSKNLGLWKVEEVGRVERRKSWVCERPKNLGL